VKVEWQAARQCLVSHRQRPFDNNDGSSPHKGPLSYRITAQGAQIAGSNLVIPAKTGTMTITYQWAQ
jgi:hypothetical protein